MLSCLVWAPIPPQGERVPKSIALTNWKTATEAINFSNHKVVSVHETVCRKPFCLDKMAIH